MENVFLIVGLGNPGREYVQTRHNAGFLLADYLACEWQAKWSEERKFTSHLAKTMRGVRQVILSKPQTFMNASGAAVGKLVEFYKILPAQILILVDDADLPLGHIRLRKSGSSGGHHGLESIEHHLGSREFPRLRIGIGRLESGVREITNYVLGRFSAEEGEGLEKVMKRATGQVECWLNEGIDQAMNKFNGAIVPPKKEK